MLIMSFVICAKLMTNTTLLYERLRQGEAGAQGVAMPQALRLLRLRLHRATCVERSRWRSLSKRSKPRCSVQVSNPNNYSSTRWTANLCSGRLTMQEKVKKYDRAVVILKVMSIDSQSGITIFSMPKATQ